MVPKRATRALEASGLMLELERANTQRPRPARLRVSAYPVSALFALEVRARAPYPGELHALATTHDRLAAAGLPLLVAPYVSARLGNLLVASDWSWLDATGNFDLCAPGLRWRQRMGHGPPRVHPVGLPRGRAAMAIVRWLIAQSQMGEPIAQRSLARLAGVSQARVSQILGRLFELGLLSRQSRHLVLRAKEPLVDAFLSDYPGAGGKLYFGRSQYSVVDVAMRAAELRHSGDLGRLGISADVGTALVVCHRNLSHVVLYADRPPEWERLGAKQTTDPRSANVSWRIPEDESVFLCTRDVTYERLQLPLADPPQMMRDLVGLGGHERFETVEMIRGWLFDAESGRSVRSKS